MTAEQLKLTNLIFAEHKYLSTKVPLLEQEIDGLKTQVSESESIIKNQSSTIKDREASIDKLKKSIKVKNNLIVGTASGFLVSLLLLICGK